MTAPPRERRWSLASAAPLSAAALLGGQLVWSMAFVMLYGLHALACALVAGDSAWLRLALGAVWLAHVAVGIVLVEWLRRRARGAGDGTRRFVAQVAVTLAATGSFATAWTGLPLLLTRACEPPPRVEMGSAHGIARLAP
jgi:hypothetical protein